MNHKGTVELETKRLILRRFKIEDAEDMFNNWAQSEEVTRYLSWFCHKSIEDSKEVISTWIDSYDDNEYYQWAMYIKGDNKTIGSIGKVDRNKEGNIMELGYCISEDYWNKGIVTEALIRISEFFFEEVDLDKLYAKHHIDNPASGKVMRKAGMEFERETLIFQETMGYYRARVYSVTKEEWFDRKKDIRY